MRSSLSQCELKYVVIAMSLYEEAEVRYLLVSIIFLSHPLLRLHGSATGYMIYIGTYAILRHLTDKYVNFRDSFPGDHDQKAKHPTILSYNRIDRAVFIYLPQAISPAGLVIFA